MDLIVRQSDGRVLDHGDSIIDSGGAVLTKQVGDAEFNISKTGIAYDYSILHGVASVPGDLVPGVGILFVPDPTADPPPVPGFLRHYNFSGGTYTPIDQTLP